MGYNIRYHEMNEYCELTQEWASAVKEVLGELKIRFQELADKDMLEGATAKAVCSYVDGFHIRVIEGITVLLEHLMSCLKVYQDDYYTNIDAFEETRLSEDAFTECIDRLQWQRGQLEDVQCEVERILKTVDFAYFQKPVEESAKYANEALVQKVRELAESVAAMEETHRNDMAGDAELVGALNRFINGSRWQSVNSNIESHVEGITGGTEGQTLDMLTGRINQKIEEMQAQVDNAEINEGLRNWERKSKEEGIYFDADLYRNSTIYRTTANYIYQIEETSEEWEETLVEIKDVYERQKERYETISVQTGIPAEVIAAIHYKENATDYFVETFGVYLHNGDPLGSISKKVPYPKYYPSDCFNEAAVDILESEYISKKASGLNLTAESEDIIAMTAFSIVYNGWYNHGKSSYAYNGTNIYSSGLYTSDYIYDPNAVSETCGTYLIIAYLIG